MIIHRTSIKYAVPDTVKSYMFDTDTFELLQNNPDAEKATAMLYFLITFLYGTPVIVYMTIHLFVLGIIYQSHLISKNAFIV